MRLTFLGAARMVTGSSYLLEADDKKVLIDCGMFQGSKAIRTLNEMSFPYNPADIDCVLLSHAHIDHSGLLPKLCKQGFNGKIYATKVTAELCSIMLPDSAHIQEFDAEIANRKRARAGKAVVEPLYTVDEAYKSLSQFSPVAYDADVWVTKKVRVRFRDAGHILGSSLLEVWVTEDDGCETKLVFSGDLGQPAQPIVRDPVFANSADYVIMETTYGNRLHEQKYNKEDVLADIINATWRRGGNLIIPSFAVGRTQTLLYYLHRLFKAKKIPDMPVIIDSPLAIAATDVFMRNVQEYDQEAYAQIVNDKDNPLKMPQLTYSNTAEESKALNFLTEPAIIISASGMADAGRILHHLKHNLWRPESSVLFVGYQAQGSLGRRILEGARRVKIMGEEISIRAEIHSMEGFSAHADQAQLLEWLGHVSDKPANVFLVHGEYDMSEPFAALIDKELKLPSCIPQYGETAVICGRTWQMEESKLAYADPAVKQLKEYLSQFEAEYLEYRKKIDYLLLAEGTKASDIMVRLQRISDYMKKTLGDL